MEFHFASINLHPEHPKLLRLEGLVERGRDAQGEDFSLGKFQFRCFQHFINSLLR